MTGIAGLRRATGALFAGLALVCACAPALAQEALTGDLEALRRTALDAVNRDRAANGLASLTPVPALEAAAQAHAEDMLARDYFAHESPDGARVRERYTAEGGPDWRLVGENISMCRLCAAPPGPDRVERFQAGWMDSEGHRRNILDPGFAGFGFGVAASAEGVVYAVQTFDGPGVPVGASGPEPQAGLTAAAAQQAMLDAINAARLSDGASALHGEAGLQAAARALLSDSPDRLIDEAGGADPYGALPEADRSDWRKLLVLAARCMGCGARATGPDIEYFAGQWLDDSADAAQLLSGEFTHMGFAVSANGDGMKTAILVLAVEL